ncbi:MAG: glycoside hydrolase family 9 protein, partial [Xenococcus sp. (in: cyanobacteria)]
MQIPDPMTTPDATASYNEGSDGHNHGGDGHTHGEPLPDTGSDPLASGGRVFKQDGTTQRITNFNLATDKVDLGPDSIHNQIAIDTPEGIVFQNYHHLERSLTLVGVSLKDLKADNFTPIADAHLQQDLSAALAWENGEGFVRPNTIYIRSHEQNLQEEVEFDPAKDKISFFYLSVRGDSQQNFAVEETTKGVRFYSPVTGQSITLKGIKFSDLNSSHFEWRANQLEDNIAGRMGLSDKIADFRIVQSNVFNGKSVAMAGGVDRAPYHSQPEYTGTRIGSNLDPMPTPDPDPMPTPDPDSMPKPDPDPMPTPDPDPMPTGNSEVNFAITNNWGSGYQGEVEITNKSTSDLNNWTLKFEFAGNIEQIWGAEIVSQTGNTYVLRNAPYNGTVASGDKVAFGFIAEGSTSNLPKVFELNGKVVGEMPTTPTDPDPMKSTIAEIVAQSGGEFDGNNQDFDILLKALQAGGLVDAVADPAADLTVFAPTDAAFIKLAQDLGYQGSDETGAYNAIVGALTDLGNGDPIPVLQNVLKYHVSPGAKTLNEVKGANSVSTLLDGANITPNGNILGDKEPDLANPKFVNNLTNVEASNGIVQGIDRVLIPLDIPGNSAPTEPTDPTTPTEPTMPGGHNHGGHNHNGDHPGAFNYAEAIQKSFLFYEANRSGELPADNRIPWRGDSALSDGADVGRDLTGGYYDAGDHVKFGFPMAASMTMLAWGGEQYGDAYDKIGQKDELLDTVKWGTDYFLKTYDDKGTADVSDDVLYGQVGNGQADHSFWGPPERMTMNRPTYQIDAQNPGSDLAGEYAASMASASILFRSSNPAYADQLLTQAKKVYEFAETYKGKYSDSITDA